MIVRLAKAAELCGVHRTTLYRWTLEDERVRNCLFRPGWFVVERLAGIGLCQAPGT